MLTPAIQTDNATVYCGNNLEILPTLPDNSVDSIITDPPYELGFMGKAWDNSGIAYSVELWQECLRVLKPGGHLLAFGGSRTWHRLAVAIEDAGFEMRDSIAWLYGSGFPKSHNISKAIDKHLSMGVAGLLPDEKRFCEWMQKNSGITITQSKKILGSARFITGQVEVVNTATTQKPNYGRRAMIPTYAAWQKIKPLLAVAAPDWIESLVKEPPKPAIEHPNEWKSGKGEGTAGNNEWAGWGTALKPAFEPIVVARKPLIGTVAENVLQFGVGGLNIDASRIDYQNEADQASATPQGQPRNHEYFGKQGQEAPRNDNSKGRWPANVILDETTAKLLDEQSGITKSSATASIHKASNSIGTFKTKDRITAGHTDSGGASRFFYVAKASKRDRNEGLDELPEQIVTGRDAGQDARQVPYKTRSNPVKNIHPTVKPTTLMTYLIKLVTPEAGIVLDPFTGSGSTGKASLLEGYTFIGIELTAEYLPIIEGRLKHAEQTKEAEQQDDLFF